MGKSKDAESADGERHAAELGFTDKSIRHGFIRKVYSILVCQLLFSCGVIALFLYHEPTQLYFKEHKQYFWIALCLLLASFILMSCCGKLRRKIPLNFIFLFTFTLAESFLLGVTASTFSADVVLMAGGITCGIAFSLTLFAFQTKIKFNFLSGAIFVGLLVVIICGVTAAIFPSKGILMVYAGVGVFLFSLYLVYDTQTMVGGTHSDSISPEEYIFAALCLYLDVMKIFQFILFLVGCIKKGCACCTCCC